MNKRWIWLAAAALLAIVVVAAACGDDDDDDAPSGTATAGDVNEITVTMSDELSFDPNEITVKVGQPVRLTVNNSGAALHDFTVEEIAVEDVMSEGSQASPTAGHGMTASAEFALHVPVDGGSTGTLEFTPTEAGEYEFMCTVTGHAEAGMTGMLIVTE